MRRAEAASRAATQAAALLKPSIAFNFGCCCFPFHLPQNFNRKLPDVERRLGTLRERLTDDYLDDETVQYLNYLLQFLQAKDYQNALGYHQYLVTNTNPDVTGAFLLGIKSLVNIAKAVGC